MIWKTALYIRLSKEDGNDVSLSVVNQQDILTKYLKESDLNYELNDIYIDDGKTGTDSLRKNFQRLLEDIENKKVNCVIVKDLSRLSRNYVESGMYLEQYFVEKDVRFISLELPKLDSYLNPEEVSSIATAFQNIVNDDFCRQTSIKIRGTFNSKRADGEFISSFAPYGYKKKQDDKHKLEIDEEPAQVVKDIFKWFVNGQSKTGIAIKLNDLGILSPAMYKKFKGTNYKNPHIIDKSLWSLKTIDTILKNEVYLGHMLQGKTKVKSYKIHKLVNVPEEEWFRVNDTHQPIIDQSIFNKASDLLKRDIKTINHDRKTHLFSGFLRCADCKKAMHRQTTKNYVYYSCKTYKTQSKKVCSKHSIREDELIRAVTDAINTQIALIEDKKKIIDDIRNTPISKDKVKQIETSLNKKEIEIEKINRIRDSLYLDWKNEDITRNDFLRLRENHDNKLNALRENLILLKSELETIKNEVNSESPIFQLFSANKKIEKLNRSLLIEFIDTIYIEENKKIKIQFKFTDQINHLLLLIEENDKINTEVKTKSKKLSF